MLRASVDRYSKRAPEYTGLLNLKDNFLLLHRSFDHLVGDREHPGRHLDAKRFRGMEVDDEFKLSCTGPIWRIVQAKEKGPVTGALIAEK
jgi:hypothetical protein